MWQPIETAPKDGTPILLHSEYLDWPVVGWWVDRPKSPFRFVGWTDGWQTNGGYDTGWNEIYKPTHWLPIPPIPGKST